MSLSPEEQQELAQLQAKFSPSTHGGLTPAEQTELATLHQRFAGQTPNSQNANDESNSPLKNFLNKGKSFVEGAAQGLTLGNVGNIGGAVGKIAEYLNPNIGGVDRDLESKGFKIQEPSAFDLYKNGTNQELDKSYQANPWTYRAGFLGGSMPLAAPGRAVFDAAGGGIKGGAALGAAQGALSNVDTSNPENQAIKAAGGAVLGGTLQGTSQAASKALDLIKEYAGHFARMTPAQVEAYLSDVPGTEKMADLLGNASENPQGMVDLQNKAVDAINTSRKNLKLQGLQDASKLSGMLNNKTVEIDPSEYLGLDPRADEILNKHIAAAKAQEMYPSATGSVDSVEIPANEVNALKRYFQQGADFAKGTVTDPQQKARVAQLATKAAGLRSAIENVEPGAADLNKSMQDSMLLQEALRKGAKSSPLAFVSSESPDRMSTLARAETKGAGGLFDLGNQVGAAKSVASKNVGSGIDASILKAAGRAGLRGVSLFQPSVDELKNFPWLQQITQEAAESQPSSSRPSLFVPQ